MRANLFVISFFLAVCTTGAAAFGQASEKKTVQYKLTADFTSTLPTALDTSFILYHRHRITDKYSPFNAYPGNYGLPLYQISFFDRPRDPDSFLYQHYYPFMYLPATALFIDTQVPFTEMVFTYAGPARNSSEQTFRIRHSQNINRYFNIGVIYDIVYSLGHYAYQKAENKNFLLHTSYLRDKYRLYGALGINNIYSNENGGVVNNMTLSQYDTKDVPVRLGGLNRAISTLRNRNLLLVQQYAPTGFLNNQGDEEKNGLTGTFTHVFLTDAARRSYFDAYPQSGFYDTTYINTATTTLDSLSSFMVANTVRFDFGFRTKSGFSLQAGAGIRHEYHSQTRIIPFMMAPDTVVPDTASWNHQNLALTGKLENKIGSKFGWEAAGDLYFGGTRAGDFDVKGSVYKDFTMKKGTSRLAMKGNVSLLTPSVWFTRWAGNHFVWNNNTDKREFTIMTGAELDYPERLLNASFRYAVIDNFAYFDTAALPARHGGALSVVSVTADKTIAAGGFRFGNTVALQKSSNSEVLDLPLVTFRSALWFDKNIHFKLTDGYMHIETGAEVFMHTGYHPMNYMPATGRYYNQQTNKTGNYPIASVFLNAKIKRTRISLSFDHVNWGISGQNYFLIPDYPLNIRMFRYGIAWTFYD
ncbi:MAG: hypothetical protein IH591_07025 [Bacteroidales bacterium]|nr:hypothetical protein [Bacteroidales bacterium]